MSKFLLVSIIGLSAAIAFGYLGAAAMATDLGVAVIGAVVGLIVLSGVFQGTHMLAHTRHA